MAEKKLKPNQKLAKEGDVTSTPTDVPPLPPDPQFLDSRVEECYNEALALQAEGRNPYPGSNYVGGVIAALSWVLGESDDAPLEW